MKAVMHHTENTGVSYYRIWQQAKYLERLGWEVVKFPDHQQATSMEQWEEYCSDADIFISQKSDEPKLIALLAAIRDEYNIPVVFEIDDDIYDVSKSNPAYKFYYPGSPFLEMNEMLMDTVDAMTVSTEQLAERYRKYCPNVYVLENCQDPEDWENLSVVKGRQQSQVVIGWAGSVTHYDDLKLIWQPMKKVLRNNPNAIFRVIGCMPDFLAGHPQVELRPDVAPIREWQSKLASMQFDIGLCPITTRAFNAGKSNIKWQEYGMLSLPTVASNFGPYKSIEHGVDGYLASNDSEWFYFMDKLVKSADDRKALGEAAKRRVLTDFNIEKNIVQWEQAYRTIIDNFKSVSH